MLTEASTERNLYKGMIEERDAKLLHSSNLNADLEEKVQILTSGNSVSPTLHRIGNLSFLMGITLNLGIKSQDESH